jgi:hypothetical protein
MPSLFVERTPTGKGGKTKKLHCQKKMESTSPHIHLYNQILLKHNQTWDISYTLFVSTHPQYLIQWHNNQGEDVDVVMHISYNEDVGRSIRI